MKTASILLGAGFCVSIMFLFRPRNVPRGRLHRTVEVGVARMSSGSDAREPGELSRGVDPSRCGLLTQHGRWCRDTKIGPNGLSVWINN